VRFVYEGKSPYTKSASGWKTFTAR
jgi:hypothetical protein